MTFVAAPTFAESIRAILQDDLGNGKSRCNVCAYRCELSEGQTGLCRVRKRQGGEIRYYGYERVNQTCPAQDTCGAGSHCIGAGGCNWGCTFCINTPNTNPEYVPVHRDRREAKIDRNGFLDRKAFRTPLDIITLDGVTLTDDDAISPAEVAQDWKDSGLPFIAMRGSEPSIHVEAVRDIFSSVREQGGGVLINTNGYWTPELVEVLGPHTDIINVGVKASGNELFLRKVCGVPKRQPIFDTIEALVALGKTVLVSDVPVFHDGFEQEFDALCRYVARTIPVRDQTRFKVLPWTGAVPEVGFGSFLPGIPDGDGFDRAALLHRCVEIAGRYLDRMFLHGLDSAMSGSERDAFLAGIEHPLTAHGRTVEVTFD